MRSRQRARFPTVLAALVVAASVLATSAACAPAPRDPEAAVMRTTPPPWDAPRDAVSHIEAAGLVGFPVGHPVVETVRTDLVVRVDGEEVGVPAFVGIDRVRGREAVLHTHADDGVLWVESPEPGTEATLGQFLDLWGVRLDERCLGDACGGVEVRIDGRRVDGAVRDVVLRDGEEIELSARR